MHHSLRFYGKYQSLFLRYYIFQSKWMGIPLIGRLVRGVAGAYGKNMAGAHLLTTGEAEEIVDISGSLFLGPCACRAVFKNCDNPLHTEIMVGLTKSPFQEERPHDYREITREEAKDILEDCHRRGLIPTIVRCRDDFYAICNCCSCCCVPLRLNRKYGISSALTRSNNIVREFEEYQRASAG